MLYVYIGCFSFGIVYSLVSLILGGHGADHGGADYGGIDHGGAGFEGAAHGGLDHADLHGDAASDGADMPSPFNPLVIASAITTFGAAGLIAKLSFKMSDIASSALSLGFAGVIGALLFFGVVKFMYGSQSNSTFSLEDLVGAEAEIITPVPCKGLGEIAYVMNGVRYNMSARSAYNKEIRRGETVMIKEITGNIAVVTQKVTIDDVDSMAEDFTDRPVRKKLDDEH